MTPRPQHLPPPPTLRRALVVRFWWGVEEYELVAPAAAVRVALYDPPGGTRAGVEVLWLHCLAIPRADVRPAGSGPVSGYLLPAAYVTEAREWGTFHVSRHRPGGDLRVFPPVHPPPVIPVPPDELVRLIDFLTDSTAG